MHALQDLCVEITAYDVLGSSDHPHLVLPCAMAASRMIESIVSVSYSEGLDSFPSDQVPEVITTAKALLCYAFLWARDAYVAGLPVEPESGLVLEWLEDVSEHLPLSVRRKYTPKC